MRKPDKQTVLLISVILGAILVVAYLAFFESDGHARGPLSGLSSRDPPPPTYGYKVVNTYPHKSDAFCQGLAFADGHLYEGTGMYGRSSLRQVDLKTGNVLKSVALSRNLFGEGIAVWGDRIVQLTWKSRIGFVYDRKTFKVLGRFTYSGEGWGITHDGKRLIVSDGSSTLRFLDPQTFQVVRRLQVHSRETPVKNLNELEYVGGEIFANVWGKDRIARIDPETGKVVGWIDLSGLRPKTNRFASDELVLNGIAYDEKDRRLFVTGKNWPKLYEIRLVRQSQ